MGIRTGNEQIVFRFSPRHCRSTPAREARRRWEAAGFSRFKLDDVRSGKATRFTPVGAATIGERG